MSSWFQTYGFADVFPNLLIGAYPLDRRDVGLLANIGVQRVLNLVEDDEYRPGEREEVLEALAAAGIHERRMALVDFGGLSTDELEAAVQTVNEWLDDGARVYLHCRAGWQRSAAVAAGVVAIRAGTDVEEALRLIQSRKPTADPLPHQRDDLRRWWDERAAAS